MTSSPATTRRRTAIAVACACALVLAACSTGSGSDGTDATTSTTEPTSGGPTTTAPLGSGPPPIADGIRIEVLSSQPDRVSGDDARIRVSPSADGRVEDLQVVLDETDITGSLDASDGALEGVVTGLIEGNNKITVADGSAEAIQRIRAWPIAGPIISGPHLPLLACSTEEHGLGAPLDDDCSAATRVTWRYIDTAGSLQDLPDVSVEPADLGRATIAGAEVPLYVRYEQGVINRSVYEIASIDATPGDDDPTGPGWNQKLLYRYGGGCGTTYGQGTSLTTAADPEYLRQGYAVATATFNTFQVQCNDVLSAETTMMVKERVIEEFGSPQFTIGEGASGGSIQLHLMAQNYPGLVNGIVALLPFPDALSISGGVTDCGLLLSYYDTAAGKGLSDAQRTAINGHASSRTCQTWKDSFLEAVDPTVGCDPKISAADIYDPVTNRGGVRCTLQDANRNQMGLDPATGWAARPLDNVGLQYGLEALNAGTISVDEFLDLNEAIGGYDIDGNIVATRAEADEEAVFHAYETGRVSMGGGDQTKIPIIDVNVFTDPAADIHDRFRAFSLRDRLPYGSDDGTSPGFQIWTRDPGDISTLEALGNAASGGDYGPEAVAVVDEWLTDLKADRSGNPLSTVLADTRPDEAVDNCLLDGAKDPIRGLDVYEDGGACTEDFPIAGDPRTAAGAPRSNEILKCTVKQVDPTDYEVPFSADQFRRLEAIFGQGVCDWDMFGTGETVPANPDRSYADVETPGQSA